MGNRLEILPDDLVGNGACMELNVADNCLSKLPSDWSGMTGLRSLLLYGNQVEHLDATIAQLPSLSALWAEGNPLQVGLD